MTIGEKIKRLRLEKGLTQEQFAEKAGVLKQSVSLWERGKMKPRITAVNKLSEAFGVNFLDVLLAEPSYPHWVSAKERLPEKSGRYVCAALLPDERGGTRELMAVYTFERASDADKGGRWEAPRSIIAYWLEGLEMPDMEGVL